MTSSFQFNAIGSIATPYKEKFSIPRQPGLADLAKGIITLTGEANNPELLRGLEQYSHIWLLFIFSDCLTQGWKPLVRPPRLGGNKKLGVLATRSTFRPNPIGMSAVKLDEIVYQKHQTQIVVSGIDLLDQTPIIDIKPYIAYSDAIDIQDGFAQQAPSTKLTVDFSEFAKQSLQKHHQTYPELGDLICQVLSQDPRPAYKKDKLDDKIYGIVLYEFNIKWQVSLSNEVNVIEIEARE